MFHSLTLLAAGGDLSDVQSKGPGSHIGQRRYMALLPVCDANGIAHPAHSSSCLAGHTVHTVH